MFSDTHEERPYPPLKTIVKITDSMKLHKFRSTELLGKLALFNGFILVEGKVLFPRASTAPWGAWSKAIALGVYSGTRAIERVYELEVFVRFPLPN